MTVTTSSLGHRRRNDFQSGGPYFWSQKWRISDDQIWSNSAGRQARMTQGLSMGGCAGGTDLERGYGDVWPWRPPFHASPVVHKGPISSKRVSSQDPLLRKFGNFSLYSLNFHPNFSSQALILKFLAYKPPNLEIFSSQAPKFGNF